MIDKQQILVRHYSQIGCTPSNKYDLPLTPQSTLGRQRVVHHGGALEDYNAASTGSSSSAISQLQSPSASSSSHYYNNSYKKHQHRPHQRPKLLRVPVLLIVFALLLGVISCWLIVFSTQQQLRTSWNDVIMNSSSFRTQQVNTSTILLIITNTTLVPPYYSSLSSFFATTTTITPAKVVPVPNSSSISSTLAGNRTAAADVLLSRDSTKNRARSDQTKLVSDKKEEEEQKDLLLLPTLSYVEKQHVVFIGDWMLRNSFLDFVDRIHNSKRNSIKQHQQRRNTSEKGSWTQSKRHPQWTTPWIKNDKNITSHYYIVQNDISMLCDCQQQQPHSVQRDSNDSDAPILPLYEIENRYYINEEMSVTYLKVLNDNNGFMVQGRYHPHDIIDWWNTTNNNRNNNNNSSSSSTSVLERRIVWDYKGIAWDQLFIQYVSKLIPKPTAIVINVGSDGSLLMDTLELSMGRILQAASDIVGEKGVVIWRETNTMEPMRNQLVKTNSLSSVDQTAKDWSYRIRNVVYHPFPTKKQWMSLILLNNNSTQQQQHHQKQQQSDLSAYWNDSDFYRYWNNELDRALWKEQLPIRQIAFIVVGAVRTLPGTHHTMMQNLVRQLCPPYQCKSHIILHLSGADNRPNPSGLDPKGVPIKPRSLNTTLENETFFQDPSQYNWPADYLQFHTLDEPYEIGSPDEHDAMNRYEQWALTEAYPNRTDNEELVRRLRVLRFGDPRRYSMWFARAWAWRYVQNSNISFDYYVFVRPDLMWYSPIPTMTFFRDFAGNWQEREIWIHDRYYANVPDTFAFLPSQSVADDYFSLSKLMRPGVACLGGPDLKNRTLVLGRLQDYGISFLDSDWCPYN